MFTLNVAIRFLSSKKRQTLLIVLGFAIGISVNIFVGSLIQSLQDNLIDTTIGNQPHIEIKSNIEDPLISDYETILTELQTVSEIEKISTSLDTRSFIININPDSPDDIIMRGMDLERANGIYGFYDDETFVGNQVKGDNEVLIGLDLSEQLDVKVGDELILKSDPSPFKPNQTVQIAGIFDLGVSNLNSLWVLSNQKTVETVANITDSITSINIQVNDIFQADITASEIETMLDNENLEVLNWKETNESLLSGLQAQSQSTNIIQVFVLLAVVIGISSILGITVLQKSRQIGILKAMGLNDRGAALVFLFEGLIFGILGGIAGVGMGIGLIWSFNTFAGGAEAGLFDIIIYNDLVLFTLVVAIVSSIFAALIPARNSSKMEVIDIIRNN